MTSTLRPKYEFSQIKAENVYLICCFVIFCKKLETKAEKCVYCRTFSIGRK